MEVLLNLNIDALMEHEQLSNNKILGSTKNIDIKDEGEDFEVKLEQEMLKKDKFIVFYLIIKLLDITKCMYFLAYTMLKDF